jgi:hypothetical protein
VAVVIKEPLVERQLAEPSRRTLGAIEMHLLHFAGEVVGISLQLEGRAATDRQRVFKKRLKRDDGPLPGERSLRPAIDLPRGLLQPARLDVLAAEGGRIAVLGQPGRIDDEPLRQVALQPV